MPQSTPNCPQLFFPYWSSFCYIPIHFAYFCYLYLANPSLVSSLLMWLPFSHRPALTTCAPLPCLMVLSLIYVGFSHYYLSRLAVFHVMSCPAQLISSQGRVPPFMWLRSYLKSTFMPMDAPFKYRLFIILLTQVTRRMKMPIINGWL